jgi:uncharacterized protein (DUF58 family)
VGRGQASSLEVSDHRAYAPGDDFRRIDWNAFARLNTLNIKVSEPRLNLTLHLLIDRSTSMDFGVPTKSRFAQQIAACLGYLALSQLDGVRFYAMCGEQLMRSPRYSGKGQAAEALRHVELLKVGRETDLASALGAFVSRHPEPGLAVVLSDVLSPTDVTSGLRQIASAGLEVALVHILSEDELHPPVSGNLEIVDSETGKRRRIGVTREALLAYEQRLDRWRAGLADQCRTLRVRYAPLTSERPIESVLLSDLRRYGLVE